MIELNRPPLHVPEPDARRPSNYRLDQFGFRRDSALAEQRADCPNCGYRNTVGLRGNSGRCFSCRITFHLSSGSIKQLPITLEDGTEGLFDARMSQRSDIQNAEREAKAAAKAQRIWQGTEPLEGSVALRNLDHRYVGAVDIGDDVRAHSRLIYWDGERKTEHFGMVGAVRKLGVELIGIHRTFLSPDGRGQAGVSAPKQTLGPCSGGYITVTRPRSGCPVIVAEGIVTALAAHVLLGGLPAISALSAGNLADRLELPPDMQDIIIAADNDEPRMNDRTGEVSAVGRNAAFAAARRWEAEGRRVTVEFPQLDPGDFADVLHARHNGGCNA